MCKRFGVSFLLAAVGACGHPAADAPVSLEWSQGQTWHLAASYRMPSLRTERGTVDLDGTPSTDAQWSDEVVWTYQVVDSAITPATDDVLYDFAITPRGTVRELDVVRAWLDIGLNDPSTEWFEADPVVYLVFTHKRQRLAGIVSYTTEGNSRSERAYSSKQLGRSWSTLSQSMLTAVPTYLAPHGIRLADSDRRLENGSWLNTSLVDEHTVDAIYNDELGGGTVASRYELGEPWPTWTVADNVEVSLLDATDVNQRRRRAASAPPEDYDFRAGLAASLDIDAAMMLAEDDIDATHSFGAPLGYEPWNGSWWPQAKADLVFGFTDNATLSDDLRADIDPLKIELDGLNDTLRDNEEGSEAHTVASERYSEAQSELIDKLVGFYGGVLEDLDEGRLTVADGALTHEDGRSWLLDNLSPMDKVALVLYQQGQSYPNPFYIPAWELLNHYSPEGGSWWGHCNGWSAAAILNDEPTDDVLTTIGDDTVAFSTGDVKGLLTETHYSTLSSFYGARYYDEDSDVADLSPANFHRILTFYLRDQQVPLVFDTEATEQVWNYPAYGAEVEIALTDEANTGLINVNTADFDTLDSLPGIGSSKASAILDYREDVGGFQTVDELDDVRGIGPATLDKLRPLVTVDPVERIFAVTARVDFADDAVEEAHIDDGSPGANGFTKEWSYTLVTDADGLVLRGEWSDDHEHPDFAWVPTSNPATAGGSENTYLSQSALVDALGVDLTRN